MASLFMWQSLEILNLFNILTLKHIFWKTKSFFEKLDFCFLVESTKIEKTSSPSKTVAPEVNVKTNGMVSIKWTYHEERSFASNYFIFLNFFFRLRSSYKELVWCTNHPNLHICTFCKRWRFMWWCLFPVSILKT